MFLIQGGTTMQYRLPSMVTRPTQDIGDLVRGDIDRCLTELDVTFGKPWGPLTLVRGEVEIIDVPHKLIKPRRFDMTVLLNSVNLRRVQIEVSPRRRPGRDNAEQTPSP
ncbi:hypothetical protein DIJ64_09035 [Mycobacterium leprae]|uniref:Uncharacterized protein n=1 Tax=Mycobacterium leprae TaxID=1769 RepID=A0AAD0KVR3_MYCLR|nr:hypothetical protein DIJ64_09035 [Mycobacterium leprae]